jgi:hypothetical protein
MLSAYARSDRRSLSGNSIQNSVQASLPNLQKSDGVRPVSEFDSFRTKSGGQKIMRRRFIVWGFGEARDHLIREGEATPRAQEVAEHFQRKYWRPADNREIDWLRKPVGGEV